MFGHDTYIQCHRRHECSLIRTPLHLSNVTHSASHNMSVSPSSMVSRHVSKKVKAQPRRRVSSSLKTAGGSEHRAKIEHLFPIPLELHFEVCSLRPSTKNPAFTSFRHQILWDLGPNDLLNLARTNKSFRALLRDKACDVYWKAALKTYRFLPHCPPGMPLRMFASLAFETFCQVYRFRAHDYALV